MSKKRKQDIDTFIIGPSCCGNFSAKKQLCHWCIAKGFYNTSICFVPPVSVGTREQENERLQAVQEIVAGADAPKAA